MPVAPLPVLQIRSPRTGQVILPEERRAIERQLKDGTMKGVVSTNALELGIDIGSLDAVIISGYPGTMMSTRQQAGRAGRKGMRSLAILVAQANPLDQYFMHHPDQFFARSHEHAIVDTENPYIVSGHLLCAAAELPGEDETDREFFGDSILHFFRILHPRSGQEDCPGVGVFRAGPGCGSGQSRGHSRRNVPDHVPWQAA